jgi:hypothetical protein
LTGDTGRDTDGYDISTLYQELVQLNNQYNFNEPIVCTRAKGKQLRTIRLVHNNFVDTLITNSIVEEATLEGCLLRLELLNDNKEDILAHGSVFDKDCEQFISC